MTTRIDTEEIASTKSEKFLAVVLAIFVLIGASWTYVKIHDWTGASDAWSYSESQQQILDQRDEADGNEFLAEEHLRAVETDLNSARADLDLAVNRGEPTADLEVAYEDAQSEFAQAKENHEKFREEAATARAAAEEVERDHRERADDGSTWREWLSAGLRLALIAGMFAGSLAFINRLRVRDSRYLPLGFALAGSAVVMALVFAVDYITDFIDILELGPIILSLFGIAVTIAAFAALQRYLARRIPRARVRKNECPFCGFPVHGDGPHCEGCGREVVATCASCSSPRRVGSPHCPHCGTA